MDREAHTHSIHKIGLEMLPTLAQVNITVHQYFIYTEFFGSSCQGLEGVGGVGWLKGVGEGLRMTYV